MVPGAAATDPDPLHIDPAQTCIYTDPCARSLHHSAPEESMCIHLHRFFIFIPSVVIAMQGSHSCGEALYWVFAMGMHIGRMFSEMTRDLYYISHAGASLLSSCTMSNP